MKLGRAAVILLCVALASCALHSQRMYGDYVTAYYEGMAAYERSDYVTAMTIFKQLAIDGDALSQLYVGSMYERGEGVAKDEARAVRWYLKSAEQGNVDAQMNLAEMYSHGAGIDRDDVQAYVWCSLAAEQGEPSAVGSLASLRMRMTPHQILEAEQYAGQLREAITKAKH